MPFSGPDSGDRGGPKPSERAGTFWWGGTGSGKTTFANALLKELASGPDRIYLVEDNAELQCTAANRVQVLVQPPIYTWNRAILDAMRFRPDRVIVGEVRDGSALEMLKAWNTGHPGGIATVHANDTAGMLDRICQLVEEIIPARPGRSWRKPSRSACTCGGMRGIRLGGR